MPKYVGSIAMVVSLCGFSVDLLPMNWASHPQVCHGFQCFCCHCVSWVMLLNFDLPEGKPSFDTPSHYGCDVVFHYQRITENVLAVNHAISIVFVSMCDWVSLLQLPCVSFHRPRITRLDLVDSICLYTGCKKHTHMSHADVFPQIILKLHIFLETEKVSHQNWIASLSSIPVCFNCFWRSE